jgi:cysteine desulfurase
MIYLDYAANTPVDDQVLETFCEYSRAYIGNPNSYHSAGSCAKQAMDTITNEIASLLSVNPSEIIYTSGASESNNMAIKGIASTYRQKGKHCITTVLDHSSISGAFTALQTAGYEIDLVNINNDGRIDIDHLKELIRKDTILVAISYVDSELGVVQPIKEIAELLAQYPSCHLHVDGTQAVGRIPFDLSGIHTFSFAPHKFFGINGCGVLIKKEGFVIEPLIHGGASTTVYRSGTPTVGLAASILKALELAFERQDSQYEHVKQLVTRVKQEFATYPLLRLNSTEYSVPHILNVSVKGVKADLMQAALDEMGVCISTKSACSVKNTPSRAVYAVTKDKKNGMYSFRMSFSYMTTQEEIELFLQKFKQCYEKLAN